MLDITSTSNPRIKEILKLRNRKDRSETKLAFIEGLRIVIEAYEQGVEFDYLVYSESLLVSLPGRKLVEQFSKIAEEKILSVSEAVFRHLSGKEGPQGLAGVIRQRWSKLENIKFDKEAVIVALDEAADPGNLGTIMRTADAVGSKAVILLDNCTDPYDLTAIRASMGALFDLQLIKCTFDEFISWKARTKINVFGAAGSSSADYHFVNYSFPMVLLMGSERHGLSQRHLDICDQTVSIPMFGRSDSLNLAMATGIILYEILNHQRNQKNESNEKV